MEGCRKVLLLLPHLGSLARSLEGICRGAWLSALLPRNFVFELHGRKGTLQEGQCFSAVIVEPFIAPDVGRKDY